jgi:hypothetical protein
MHSCEAGDIRCALLSPEEGAGGKFECKSLSHVCSCLSELNFGLDPKQEMAGSKGSKKRARTLRDGGGGGGGGGGFGDSRGSGEARVVGGGKDAGGGPMESGGVCGGDSVGSISN